ncbi:DUF167 domain-containing protein [Candidatus Kaiserbacteria bacterium]|nr:DUF167 domain-containing protein [Candidatus Kaiserbacteria bacterium]MCB9811970.1 DUF167 domain-containing protein [Candidatus Nomurabacteria bacterium]
MAKPNARKQQVVLTAEYMFNIAVKEAPKQGAANQRIRQILSEWYDVPVKNVRCITGHRSLKKKFDITLPN